MMPPRNVRVERANGSRPDTVPVFTTMLSLGGLAAYVIRQSLP